MRLVQRQAFEMLSAKGRENRHTPLEINLLGMRLGRNYPDERFWAIAGEVGNTVVLGCDAHKPEDVCGGAAELEALRLVKKYSLRLRETITLRQI